MFDFLFRLNYIESAPVADILLLFNVGCASSLLSRGECIPQQSFKRVLSRLTRGLLSEFEFPIFSSFFYLFVCRCCFFLFRASLY